MSDTATSKPKGRGMTYAIVGIVVVIAIIAGVYYVLGGGMGGGGTTNAKVTIPSGASTGLNFSPNAITVVIGKNNTITFTNDDSVTHTITFTTVPSGVTASAISDSSLAPGASYTVTLATAGNYHYQCSIHPGWMQANIVVSA